MGNATSSTNGLVKSDNHSMNNNLMLATNSSTGSNTATSSFMQSSGSASSSFQSSMSSAFSSKMVKSSSSFQSSTNMSQKFEAFPGMGGIENMNLEGEKAGK